MNSKLHHNIKQKNELQNLRCLLLNRMVLFSIFSLIKREY